MDQRVVSINGHDQPYLSLLVWAGLATAPGLPVTVVPTGLTPGGLPVGVQIIGPFGGDRITLAAGAWLDEILGGFTAPPRP